MKTLKFEYSRDAESKTYQTDFVATIIEKMVECTDSIIVLKEYFIASEGIIVGGLELATTHEEGRYMVYWGGSHIGHIIDGLSTTQWFKTRSPEERAAFMRGLSHAHGIVCNQDESGVDKTVTRCAEAVYKALETAASGGA